MNFEVVSKFFESIEKTSSRLEITTLLADLFKQSPPDDAKIIAYLSLGELLPPYKGTQFQIADKMMLKILAKFFNSSEEDIKKIYQDVGDMGLVIDKFDFISKGYLSVQEVYEKLKEIESSSGSGSQDLKIDLSFELLSSVDSLSAKYIVRILLGKLRLGFSDMTIIDSLSWMLADNKSLKNVIEHAYNVCADIGLIAYTAKFGIEEIEKLKIHVGIPIRPSAAERLPTAKDIMEKLGPGAIAQPKLDGFRLQIHVDKRDPKDISINFFSRNLIDMSYMFPDIVDSFKDLDVTTLICEGEAIVYDPFSNNFVPFQETVKRRRKHDIEDVSKDLPLKVFIFDILYLNGESLLSKTHAERRFILESIFKIDGDIVSYIEEKKIYTAKELEDYFYKNIEMGLEGLVVKRPEAVYQPGKRNFNWIKLKRQEEGSLEDTLDLVVLGYYYGQGRRSFLGIGGFLVGIYDKESDSFDAISKIGTGLTDDLWIELKKRCDDLKVNEKPKNVECVKELYPDVWVQPKIVVIVRADEITRSPRYLLSESGEMGYALRFPRFMGYAVDKFAQDSTSLDEIRSIYKEQKKI